MWFAGSPSPRGCNHVFAADLNFVAGHVMMSLPLWLGASVRGWDGMHASAHGVAAVPDGAAVPGDVAVHAPDASVPGDVPARHAPDASARARDASVRARDASVRALDASVCALDASVRASDKSVRATDASASEVEGWQQRARPGQMPPVADSALCRWVYQSGGLVIGTCASSAALCFVRQRREKSGSISVVLPRRKGVKGNAYSRASEFTLSSVMNTRSCSALV